MKLKEINKEYKYNKQRLKQWLIDQKIIPPDFSEDIYDLEINSDLADLIKEEENIIKTTPIRKKYQSLDDYEAPFMIPMTFTILGLRDTVILDTETTGLYHDDEVVELSIIDMLGREIYHSLFRPQKKIGRAASRVTGIYNPMLEDQPLFKDEWRKIIKAINGRRIIGHNVHYDYRVTCSTCLRYGIPESEVRLLFHDMIDSKAIAQRYLPNASSYKLSDLCPLFGITDPQKHRATYDCLQTLQFLRALETSLLNDGLHHPFISSYDKEETNIQEQSMNDINKAILYGYKAGKSITDLSIFYGIPIMDITSLLIEEHKKSGLILRIDEEKKRNVSLIARSMKGAAEDQIVKAASHYAKEYEIRLILADKEKEGTQ